MLGEHPFLWNRMADLDEGTTPAEEQLQRILLRLPILLDRDEVVAPGLLSEIENPRQTGPFAGSAGDHEGQDPRNLAKRRPGILFTMSSIPLIPALRRSNRTSGRPPGAAAPMDWIAP